VLQLFCTGRLLQRWPPALLLVSLPSASLLGLGVLWLAPAVLTINLVQIGRRGAQYAFEKPAREVLYTPLSLATKHKVKFLLDTFAFRLGDLAGAWLAVASGAVAWGAAGAALAWIALGVGLGRRRSVPEVRAAAQPAAGERPAEPASTS
jgi:AAA family ATP:ADP antiporter